jgi:hypothetical protein
MKRLQYATACAMFLLAFVLRDATAAKAASETPLPPGGMEESVRAVIPFGTYDIVVKGGGHALFAENYGSLLVPGKPKLPSKIFSMAIPPGAKFVDLTFDSGGPVVLDGTFDILPTPLPRVIGDERADLYAQAKQGYDDNFDAVYTSDEPYPTVPVEFVRTAGYRKYNLVDIRVTPFAYRPLSGQLLHYPDISVEVVYDMPARPPEPMTDHLERTERIARQIVLNYDRAAEWYPHQETKGRSLHDFVVITTESLTSSVQPLVDWETSKGRIVEVVTTSWIDSNYTGYDQAERIRNFLRDKYPSGEWGIEHVLIVGHYDTVPMRRTAQDLGYGAPETDFYYAELSLPDSASWDADGDHQWGEDSDPIDFYSEVNVGRIPWSASATVLAICEKTVAYEQNNDPGFKNNILLLGAFFWNDDPNPRTDNAALMEAKVDPSWMDDWTMTRMYEKNSDCWSFYDCDYPLTHSNVMSVWPNEQFAFVNWAGHGSPTSSHIYGEGAPAFISSSDCASLNDDYPAIIFADACSNSDTDHTNIGQAMIEQGAVGFVGATKVALGCPAWTDPSDGSSQSMDYFFTTYVTSGDYSQGEAHQQALRDMYVDGLWSYVEYEMFEWGSLWGNPDLALTYAPTLTILLPEGPPSILEPDVPTTFPVQIVDGTQSYVEGSARLNYRYDGGAYQSDPLVHISGDTFEATLPPCDCNDTPEFYISAQSDAPSWVFKPTDGPGGPYTALVGALTVIMEDDFETDQGWTVENDPALADGPWERGVPVGGGDRGDPPTDYDGSGQCYLTDNVDGDSDVDDGYTRVMSPTIDLSAGDADVEYALWYTNNYGDDPNNDYFYTHVSNNNGSTWVLAETVGPNSASGWFEHSFAVGDFVTPTAQVKVRFEASDMEGGSVVEAGIDAFSVTGFTCDSIPTCVDGMLNQGEDRIDCGGPCPPCDCTADAACDDGLFCDGAETCDDWGYCQAGTDPCSPDEICDEVDDVCEPIPYCATLPLAPICYGDTNGDGEVSPADIGGIKFWYGDTDPENLCYYDVNCDGTISPADVGMVKYYYGACTAESPPPCYMEQ